MRDSEYLGILLFNKYCLQHKSRYKTTSKETLKNLVIGKLHPFIDGEGIAPPGIVLLEDGLVLILNTGVRSEGNK